MHRGISLVFNCLFSIINDFSCAYYPFTLSFFNVVSIQIFCLLLMFLLLLSFKSFLNITSVVQLLSFVDSWQPHGLQHARLPCPSPPPEVYSNSCPLNWWCQPTISFAVIPFSSCCQSFPAWGSFPMICLFISSGKSIGPSPSASVFTMNIQVEFPLGLTDLISLQSKGLSRVYSSITIQRHQFFSVQVSLLSNFTSVHDYWKPQHWLYGPLLAKWCLCFLICCLGLS